MQNRRPPMLKRRQTTAIAKRGPSTPEAKARSAKNSIRHGCLAAALTAMPHESQRELDGFARQVTKELKCRGTLQTTLGHRAALLLWRLRRAAEYESSAVAYAYECKLAHAASKRRKAATSLTDDPVIPPDDVLIRLAALGDGASADKLARYETATARQLQRTLEELRRLQA